LICREIKTQEGSRLRKRDRKRKGRFGSIARATGTKYRYLIYIYYITRCLKDSHSLPRFSTRNLIMLRDLLLVCISFLFLLLLLSFFISFFLSFALSIFLFFYFSIFLFFSQSLFLSFYLYIFLSLYLSLSIYHFLSLFNFIYTSFLASLSISRV